MVSQLGKCFKGTTHSSGGYSETAKNYSLYILPVSHTPGPTKQLKHFTPLFHDIRNSRASIQNTKQFILASQYNLVYAAYCELLLMEYGNFSKVIPGCSKWFKLVLQPPSNDTHEEKAVSQILPLLQH